MYLNSEKLIANGEGLHSGTQVAFDAGYSYVPEALSNDALRALAKEAGSYALALKVKGQKPQRRESTAGLGSSSVPQATFFARELANRVKMLRHRPSQYSLKDWLPSSISYQLRAPEYDRPDVETILSGDKLLRATVAVSGETEALLQMDGEDEASIVTMSPGDILLVSTPEMGRNVITTRSILPPEHRESILLDFRMRPEM